MKREPSPSAIMKSALDSRKVSMTRDLAPRAIKGLPMKGNGDDNSSSVAPALLEMVAPEIGTAQPVLYAGGRATPPSQVVYHYEFGEWELFIREWATGLPEEYIQIKQLGGANDHGVDVAAFKTDRGFAGSWDCFQGKHYSRPLNEGDVHPEMLKVFLNTVRGHYSLPDTYQFLAPQGCGGTLEKLLSDPEKLKSRFAKRLVTGNSLVKSLLDPELSEIASLVAKTNFSMFASVQFEDMLATHGLTHYYPIRFGGPLGGRPKDLPLPPELSPEESVYVQQLVAVYSEKYPDSSITASSLSGHEGAYSHFHRQRVTFYRAEALRKFSESSVPPGTFTALQDDVYHGVIDAAERPHASSFERLSSVLQSSVQLNLASHLLMSVANNSDVKGICHQLANESRLYWDRELQQ